MKIYILHHTDVTLTSQIIIPLLCHLGLSSAAWELWLQQLQTAADPVTTHNWTQALLQWDSGPWDRKCLRNEFLKISQILHIIARLLKSIWMCSDNYLTRRTRGFEWNIYTIWTGWRRYYNNSAQLAKMAYIFCGRINWPKTINPQTTASCQLAWICQANTGQQLSLCILGPG